jgi:hypothetical protein
MHVLPPLLTWLLIPTATIGDLKQDIEVKSLTSCKSEHQGVVPFGALSEKYAENEIPSH